ncbi:hypothetical protein BDR22DRAFT_889224 [Usnea florida]
MNSRSARSDSQPTRSEESENLQLDLDVNHKTASKYSIKQSSGAIIGHGCHKVFIERRSSKLEKLVARIEKPQWKGRTTGTLGMRAFVESEKPSMKISGSPKFSKDVANSFLDFVQKKSISPEVAEDLREQRSTLNVAMLFHGLLGDFFQYD